MTVSVSAGPRTRRLSVGSSNAALFALVLGLSVAVGAASLAIANQAWFFAALALVAGHSLSGSV